MTTVAVIGASGGEPTHPAADLCSLPEQRGELDLAFHDIDAERLAQAETMAEPAPLRG